MHWVFAPETKRRFFPERCVRVGWVQRVFTVAGVQFYGWVAPDPRLALGSAAGQPTLGFRGLLPEFILAVR